MSSGGALEALAVQADTLGQAPELDGAPPPGQAEGPPLESPNLGVIVLAFTTLREASCAMLGVKSPRESLNDQAIQTCAAVLAPVADKYGINLGAQLGPEVAAALVAGPILWNAYHQLELELKAKKAKPAAGIEEVTPRPGFDGHEAG